MTDNLLDSIQPFAIALLIGLGAGIERERSHSAADNVMGMRTFMLIALLGTGSAVIGQAALTLGVLVFVTALVALGYWRATSGDRPEVDPGLTTELAGGVVFVLGFFAKSEPLLAAALGVVLVAILYFRKRLHTFAHDVLRPQEITTAILLAVFVFVFIPFIPNRMLDPWNLLNFRQLAQVVALIAVIEFCGYIAERLAGAKVGLLATGLLGGFASSTAVFLNLSKKAKAQPEKLQVIVGACLLAIVSPLLLFMAIIAATSSSLLSSVSGPTTAAVICASVLGVAIGRRGHIATNGLEERRNPLDLRGVIRLGALLSVLLAASLLAQRIFGEAGINAVSFLGGLFELHGVTLADATLHATGALNSEATTQALFLAVGASFLSKITICWVLSPGRFALIMTGLLLVIFGAGGLTAVILQNA